MHATVPSATLQFVVAPRGRLGHPPVPRRCVLCLGARIVSFPGISPHYRDSALRNAGAFFGDLVVSLDGHMTPNVQLCRIARDVMKQESSRVRVGLLRQDSQRKVAHIPMAAVVSDEEEAAARLPTAALGPLSALQADVSSAHLTAGPAHPSAAAAATAAPSPASEESAPGTSVQQRPPQSDRRPQLHPFGIVAVDGVQIESVRPGGSAGAAGLRAGDVVQMVGLWFMFSRRVDML